MRSGPRSPNRDLQAKHRAQRAERLAQARAIATHTDEEWAALLTFCEGRCCRCGSAEQVQKDHIQIIARGGSDGIESLQPLCRPCNAGKTLDATDYRPTGWAEAVSEAAR